MFYIVLSNTVTHSRAENQPSLNQPSLDKAHVCTPQVLRAFVVYFVFSNKNKMKLKLLFPIM